MNAEKQCLTKTNKKSTYKIQENGSDERHLTRMLVPTHVNKLQKEHRIWCLACKITDTSLDVALTFVFKPVVQTLSKFMYT